MLFPAGCGELPFQYIQRVAEVKVNAEPARGIMNVLTVYVNEDEQETSNQIPT